MTHVNGMIVKGMARGLWKEVQRSRDLLDKHKARQGTTCTLCHSLHTPAHTNTQRQVVQTLQHTGFLNMLNTKAVIVVAFHLCGTCCDLILDLIIAPHVRSDMLHIHSVRCLKGFEVCIT